MGRSVALTSRCGPAAAPYTTLHEVALDALATGHPVVERGHGEVPHAAVRGRPRVADEPPKTPRVPRAQESEGATEQAVKEREPQQARRGGAPDSAALDHSQHLDELADDVLVDLHGNPRKRTTREGFGRVFR